MEHPVGVEPTNTGFADLHPTDEYWMHNGVAITNRLKYDICWLNIFLTATFAVPSCLFIYTRKATSTSIVEIREIESRFEACKATVLPLNYIPISARGGSRTHKTTALNRVHIPVLLLGHNSTSGWCFSPQV